MVAGSPLQAHPGATLSCLLLAPAPDWVALDLATGALLRSSLGEEESSELLSADPLTALSLVTADEDGPSDPSRPEAVVLSEVVDSPAPRRRGLRALLGQVVSPPSERPLLGIVGPSIAYGDLDGDRPSVCLLSPDRGRVVFAGDGPLMAHFRLGTIAHALPVGAGLVGWLQRGQLSIRTGTTTRRGGSTRSSRRVGPLGPAMEPAGPVRCVVGFDRPEAGQVRKILLGVVPAS